MLPASHGSAPVAVVETEWPDFVPVVLILQVVVDIGVCLAVRLRYVLHVIL